jgi:hypothetical protein
MAEIKNYTMNFSYDRPAGLTCSRKLVCTEMHGERALQQVLR